MVNRAGRIVKIAEKLGIFVEQASRLYEKAEKEHKIKYLRERTKAW